MTLRENLKLIRKKWKMNQTEFGALLNASQYDISGYEKGKYDPKISALIRLEELTGIPVAVLYGQAIDVNKVPTSPLSSYVVKETKPSIVSEDRPAYDKTEAKKVKEEDLIDVLKLVETVKELQKKIEKMSKEMKDLQQKFGDLQDKSL